MNIRIFHIGVAGSTHSLICRIAPNLPKMSYSSSVVILNGRFFTNTIRPTSGGNRTFRLPPIGIPGSAAIFSDFDFVGRFLSLAFFSWCFFFASSSRKLVRCFKTFFNTLRNAFASCAAEVSCVHRHLPCGPRNHRIHKPTTPRTSLPSYGQRRVIQDGWNQAEAFQDDLSGGLPRWQELTIAAICAQHL